MGKYLKVFDRFFKLVTTAAFTVIVILVLLQVFVRYVVRISVPWTEELARFLLIYVTFLGAAIALREKRHIAVVFLVDKLSAPSRKWLSIVIALAILGFAYVLFRGSLVMIDLTWEVPTGSVSWLKMGYVYVAIPLGILVMVAYLFLWLMELMRSPADDQGGVK